MAKVQFPRLVGTVTSDHQPRSNMNDIPGRYKRYHENRGRFISEIFFVYCIPMLYRRSVDTVIYVNESAVEAKHRNAGVICRRLQEEINLINRSRSNSTDDDSLMI